MDVTESEAASRLHSLCTYLGAFPRHVAAKYIAALSEPDDTILDPFCGSGTTLLTAQEMGRRSIGIDANPLAVVLSRAKTQRPHISDVLHRVDELEGDYDSELPSVDALPEKFAPFFHPRVFAQLAFLRERLGDGTVDTFLKAIVVGILHGRSRKVASGSVYLSVDMPNTFSMSPAYVRRYVAENNLRRPAYDVFYSVRQRVETLLATGTIISNGGIVYRGDATRLSGTLPSASVDLIVTSPPYLGLLRYGAFNWLRLWFLKEESSKVDRSLDSTNSLDRYGSFILTALSELEAVARPGAHCVFVVGELRRRRVASLAQHIANAIVPLTSWTTVSIHDDASFADGKTTRIWGEGHRGDASDRDEALVLRRPYAQDRTM